MRLRIEKEDGFEFSFILSNIFGKVKGIIRASYYEESSSIELTHFWIENKYRKIGYGKKLLDTLISEVKNYPNIESIEVVPIPHEEDDSDEVMDIKQLYIIYSQLGFKFEEENNIVPYKSRMFLTI